MSSESDATEKSRSDMMHTDVLVASIAKASMLFPFAKLYTQIRCRIFYVLLALHEAQSNFLL